MNTATETHNAPMRDVLVALGITENYHKQYLKEGLSASEAESRLAKYGPNAFETEHRWYYPRLVWSQIKSPLIFILIIAGAIASVLGAQTDAIVIFLAVFINTIVGVYQEGRASQALKALKKSEEKRATVIRGGRKMNIVARNLVPGDLIECELGERIPADARLIDEKGLEVNESILTGEWIAVTKDTDTSDLKDDTPLTGQTSIVFMDTLVTAGWARAVVVGTGFDTEIGRIAQFVSEDVDVQAPFQKNVKNLARILGLITAVIIVALLALGFVRGEPFGSVVLISLAIAVSVIPEGLPVAVTVILALGMERILKADGLVKSLSAAETLGSTTLIITDKTGTLTKADMQVAGIKTLAKSDYASVLTMSVLVSEAFVENPEDELNDWVVKGRPMDKAIVMAAFEHGIKEYEAREREPRIDFLPFESARRFSASLHALGHGTRLYVIGSPELFLETSTHVLKNGKRVRLTNAERREFLKAHEESSGNGLRSIAIAYKDGSWKEFEHTNTKAIATMATSMTFAGLITFHDPMREDVPASIKTAREAGIRLIMATGDSMPTAKKVAIAAGILEEGRDERTIEGSAIATMDTSQLQDLIPRIDVFARMLPEQKLMLAKAARASGEVVAMTGDGVNDAPALRHADIGLALGSGTEVAKESADMVLLDNSFSVIVTAVKEGRRIIDNLKKVVAFLLSTGFSEVVLVLISIGAGLPLPILPAQILWTNIVGEGIMTFAFAFEPAEHGIMKRDPKNSDHRAIITRNIRTLIIAITSITAVVLVTLFLVLLKLGRPIEEIRAIIFFGVAIDSMFFVFSLKDLTRPLWKINIFSNKYLIVAFIINFTLLLGALTFAPIASLLSIPPLVAFDIGIMVLLGVLTVASIEMVKYILFYRHNRIVVA